jgi:transposase InsO family protein
VHRVLTDNGSPYVSRAFAQELASRGIAHRRTRLYTPRTNGKAEAMVKIFINSWAYAKPYRTEQQRAAVLARMDRCRTAGPRQRCAESEAAMWSLVVVVLGVGAKQHDRGGDVRETRGEG